MRKGRFVADKKPTAPLIPIASSSVLGGIIPNMTHFNIGQNGLLSLKPISKISSSEENSSFIKDATTRNIWGSDFAVSIMQASAIDQTNLIGGRAGILASGSWGGYIDDTDTDLPVNMTGTSTLTFFVEDIDSGNISRMVFGLDGLYIDGVKVTGGSTYTGPADGSITNAKLANMAASTIKGKTAGSSGPPTDLTAAQVRTIINVADGANNYVHPTGDGNRHVPATLTTNNGKFLKSGATAASEAWSFVTGSDVVISTDANNTNNNAQAAIAGYGVRIAGLEAIVGNGISDGDTVVNTLVEMLSTFQTWTEGVNVATVLNGKVAGNAAITGATKAKITYDSKGLVTGGADLVEADIPALSQSKITGLASALGLLAPKADPTFTGNVSLPSTTSIGNVSSIELGYLDGVTSAIQNQINSKASSASPTFTGTVGLPATTSIGTVTAAELAYLAGATSNLQQQINNLGSASSGNSQASIAMGSATAINHGDSLRLTKTITAATTLTLTNPKGGHEIVVEVTGDFAVTITGANLIGGTWLAGKVNVYNIKCWDQNGTPVYHYTITNIV
jgi:hypothetical protein